MLTTECAKELFRIATSYKHSHKSVKRKYGTPCRLQQNISSQHVQKHKEYRTRLRKSVATLNKRKRLEQYSFIIPEFSSNKTTAASYTATFKPHLQRSRLTHYCDYRCVVTGTQLHQTCTTNLPTRTEF